MISVFASTTIPAYEISTFLYFSMVTISSVGYGGIIPVNPYVRMVAAFESILGVFYIAVIVARLGVFVSQV